ncbi:uncharacterized protein TNIN_384681 [Trichonephila inaurata madagascariensis]|uniref:EGF-like domain-containing protein n=1 Tax=Trichonephila inaurata madagascariensis TaxID=2747483 RepID=A0A8X7C3Z0_9ARAC|nr:uncharacterized protein TNIN_384681 [Trichonephila inaurata madagascariensis]
MNSKMPFGKCEVFIVALATVCCVCLHGKGSHALKELKELDLAILEHELLQNYEPESRTDEEDGTVNVNSNESSVFQQAECRCKNGRCVKDGKQDVCECFPEFAKINDTDCKYCDCGPGFNCTLRTKYGTIKKICQCTDDYLQWDEKCKLKCNKDRPCQNGGSCYSGRCECPRAVSGDLCEIYPYCSNQCYPKEIVDCFYNPETRFYRCACKNRSLTYYENDQDCKPCPCEPGGICIEDSYGSVSCDCNSGYESYGRTCKKCDCGRGGTCRIDYGGWKVCSCREGYVERNGQCTSCDCGISGAKCSFKEGIKICECPEGYRNHLGYTCQCEKGYRGEDCRCSEVEKREACEDIDECREDSWACPPWKDVQCYNLPGTYKCMCKPGYEPVDMNVSPQDTRCDEYKKSWVPAIIVIVITLFMIIFTVWIHKCVKNC